MSLYLQPPSVIQVCIDICHMIKQAVYLPVESEVLSFSFVVPPKLDAVLQIMPVLLVVPEHKQGRRTKNKEQRKKKKRKKKKSKQQHGMCE